MDTTYQLKDKKLIKNYIYNGNGVFILEYNIFKKSITYKCKLCRKDNNKVFISDDKGNFIGTFFKSNNFFKRYYNSIFKVDDDVVKGLVWLAKELNVIYSFNAKMNFYHTGICSMCGEKLINEKTLSNGIGILCNIKMNYKILDKST